MSRSSHAARQHHAVGWSGRRGNPPVVWTGRRAASEGPSYPVEPDELRHVSHDLRRFDRAVVDDVTGRVFGCFDGAFFET